MRFRNQTTFNSHDTSYARENGRLVITNGVKRRCELAINRVIKAGVQGITAEHVTSSLNSTFKGSSYRETDISYALNRLVAEGLVRIVDRKAAKWVYRAAPNAATAWRNLSKIVK
jgi:hypothetical protein